MKIKQALQSRKIKLLQSLFAFRRINRGLWRLFLISFYPYNPRFIFSATFLHYLFLPYPLMLTLNINYAIIKTLIMFKLNMIGDNKYG